MQESVVQITVTGRVPVFLVVVSTLGGWKQSLFEDPGVSGLVEGGDA